MAGAVYNLTHRIPTKEQVKESSFLKNYEKISLLCKTGKFDEATKFLQDLKTTALSLKDNREALRQHTCLNNAYNQFVRENNLPKTRISNLQQAAKIQVVANSTIEQMHSLQEANAENKSLASAKEEQVLISEQNNALHTLTSEIDNKLHVSKDGDSNQAKLIDINVSGAQDGSGGMIPDPEDKDKVKSKETAQIKIYDECGQDKHIFRDEPGHLSDTPDNRKLLIDIASDCKNSLGLDKYGNQWFEKTLSDGKQVWVRMRNSVIRDGGVNDSPKVFNFDTGLCASIRPK
jgi:hypothetical protein